MKKKKSILAAAVVLSTLVFSQSAFATTTDRSNWPTVTTGSSNGYVGSLQADLWSSGLSATVGAVDHSFGANTNSALKTYQTNNGLVSDGIAGSGTWTKLESYTQTLSPTTRLYRNSGSTTYQTYYLLSPDGAGGQYFLYYLEYRSNGVSVYDGVVWFKN